MALDNPVLIFCLRKYFQTIYGLPWFSLYGSTCCSLTFFLEGLEDVDVWPQNMVVMKIILSLPNNTIYFLLRISCNMVISSSCNINISVWVDLITTYLCIEKRIGYRYGIFLWIRSKYIDNDPHELLKFCA